jgi:O-acetyl-ADP-ribose deacetylase (regulator of RNase III)
MTTICSVPDVILVDLKADLAQAAAAAGWSNISVMARTDVRDVPLTPGTAFLSPANSLGFMDGGVDMVYSRAMFPGVEARVKAAIKALGQENFLGRFYLNIGDAVTVPTQHEGVSLIAAPTMWLPQYVLGTKNAYHAMRAALSEARRQGVRRLVTPGLCTGVGGMPAEEAVAQMMAAHRDALDGLPSRYDAASIAEEQPHVYGNTEFRRSQGAGPPRCAAAGRAAGSAAG